MKRCLQVVYILYELISDYVKEVSDVIKCKLALLGDYEM
jgi:hypothetical protein